MKDKIYNLLNKIYGVSMVIAFFAGFLPVIPFIVAIVIGGAAGESISLFMYNKIKELSRKEQTGLLKTN